MSHTEFNFGDFLRVFKKWLALVIILPVIAGSGAFAYLCDLRSSVHGNGNCSVQRKTDFVGQYRRLYAFDFKRGCENIQVHDDAKHNVAGRRRHFA